MNVNNIAILQLKSKIKITYSKFYVILRYYNFICEKFVSSILKSKRFLPLFITQFFGAFNDNAFKNALIIWLTYDMSENLGLNPQIMVTVAAGVFILPFFLLSALAGQICDKYEKSRLSQYIKIIEIILMIICGILFHYQQVLALIGLLFFMGIQSTFFGPIKYSLIPEHLHKDELIKGNGLIEAGTFLSILLGTIFGGLVIRADNGVLLLSIFIILFAVIGWIASRYIPKSKIKDPNLKIGFNIYKETLKIIGYAKEERSVWLAILAISWFWFIGITFLSLISTYTKNIIWGNEHLVILFLVIFSLGICIGSILCNKLLRGKINGRVVPFGAFAISMFTFCFIKASFVFQDDYLMYHAQVMHYYDFETTLALFFQLGISSFFIVLSLLAVSISSGVYIVPLYAIMQSRSDDKYLSRIIASNNVMNALFMVAASIFSAILFAFNASTLGIFFAIALMNIPIAVIIFITVRKRLKQNS